MTAPAAGAPRAFASKVLGIRDESRGVRTFRLAVPEDFSFIPGMWVMLHFEDDPKLWRAYSISTSPSEKGFIEISLNNVGPFTQRMFALKGGEILMLKGPHGRWHWREDQRRAVLISGGTGLTPFRSMGRYAVERGFASRLTILHSARTPDDRLYLDDLERFSRAGMKVYETITGQAAGWSGPRGRIDLAVIEREVPDLREAVYYMCGPKALIADLTSALVKRGVPQERIHHERWGDYSDL